MRLSKANELLLLGQKIDSKKAVDWNICSEVIEVKPNIQDPFSIYSLGSTVCKRIDEKILSLPVGDATSKVRKFLERLNYLCSFILDVFVSSGQCILNDDCFETTSFRFLWRWFDVEDLVNLRNSVRKN